MTSFSKRWTEEDERRRIAQIKAEEKRLFMEEMGGQRGGYGRDALYDDMAGGSRKSDYSSELFPSYRQSETKSYYPPKTETTMPPAIQKNIVLPSFAAIKKFPNNSTMIEPVHWCFYCASPMRILSDPMQQAIQNLLDVRRAQFPKDAVVVDCHQPANIKTLPKIQCKQSYCQTLILTEHDRGVSFAMRGCAEHFGAINESMLEARGDNKCPKLHTNLDLYECICKNRKYCYKGSTDYKIEAASDQTPLFPAPLSSSNSKNCKFLTILLILCHLGFLKF